VLNVFYTHVRSVWLVGCWLIWSVNRHSKKLFVWETSPVDDYALLLLCGDAEFKVCLRSFLGEY
jgi:hypothetical protein